MNSIKKFTFLLSMAFGIMYVSSCTEPCDGVTCPPGFICDEGACIEDPDADPCLNVNCPPGFECVEGDCIALGYETEVISGSITADVSWDATKVYEIAGKVVVESGATLTIPAGTIIKGRSGIGSLASALIVARGGKIMAEGNATSPVIFTSTADNIEPGMLDGGNLTEFNNETWGGLIILGNAPISAELGDTEAQIEGIPANEAYGRYGGTISDDNSGMLKYVSIRHGGALIGEGNEINGLTLGGVGSGTVIDHIEIASTLDDGIEFFGGTVNITNAIISYQGDDGVDVDQNYSGTVDNFVVIHGGDDTDEALEIDGPEGSTNKDGLFTLKNGTMIAVDQNFTSGGDFKSKAQGTVENCVWRGYASHIKIRSSFDPENGCASKTDAYTNMVADKLVFTSNEVEGSISAADVARVYSDDDPGEEDCFNAVDAAYQTNVDDKILAGGNAVVGTASKGADFSEFADWTLASIRGWY